MELEKTQIKTAEVRSRVDLSTRGVFLAKISGMEGLQTVYYVSPYGSGGTAGMIAVPELFTPILVCCPEGSDSWYYMGATFSPELTSSEDKENTSTPFSRIDPGINKLAGVPAKVILQGNNGQALELSDENDQKTVNNVKAELRTGSGKKITMHDSPGIDSIKLDSGNNASITLTSNPQFVPGKDAQSIEIMSKGPQLLRSTGSDLEARVGSGGRELTVRNSANGVFWGNFQHVNPLNPCGNVNVQSDWGDVNIMSKSPLIGRIFLETTSPTGTQQLIQLQTNAPDGTIVLKCLNPTAGKIVLDATTIDINAGVGGLRLNSLGPLSIRGESAVIIDSLGPTNVNGSIVSLAGAPPGTLGLPSLALPNSNLPAPIAKGILNLGDYAFTGVL
jgi:hypothetical protein